MATLDELIAGEDAVRLAKARDEIAAERRAWQALTPAQQAARTAEFEAKYADVPDTDAANDDDVCGSCGEPDCDLDCDGDYDSEGEE